MALNQKDFGNQLPRLPGTSNNNPVPFFISASSVIWSEAARGSAKTAHRLPAILLSYISLSALPSGLLTRISHGVA